MKYFLLQGYIPEVGQIIHPNGPPESRSARLREWAKFHGDRRPQEGETCLLRVPDLGRISVYVHDVWSAHLMIAARSQERAYRLALPFRAFATIYIGYPREEEMTEYLVELTGRPSATDSTRYITENYLSLGSYPHDYELALGSGIGLHSLNLRRCAVFVKHVIHSEIHQLALAYLERSHYLRSGQMTESYYFAHYQHDRRAQTSYQRRKNYLEMSTVYDLAFLSAFRAVEALLGCGSRSLQKREISTKLEAFDDRHGTHFSTEKWESLHHYFTTRRRRWSFCELIADFLDTRNAVAAHANPSPPFPLAEDQVFELQNLAGAMLYESMMPDDFDPAGTFPV